MEILNEKDQMKVQGGVGKSHDFIKCVCGSTDIDVKAEQVVSVTGLTYMQYKCTCTKCGNSWIEMD